MHSDPGSSILPNLSADIEYMHQLSYLLATKHAIDLATLRWLALFAYVEYMHQKKKRI
jgi:hypothetical protein